MLEASIFIAHFVSTVFMAGLIWFVQIVHYPLFAGVGANEFSEYEKAHCERTGWLVMPAMLIEAGTGLALLWCAPALSQQLLFLNVLLLGLIWLATFALQVPAHRRLSTGDFDASDHGFLVRSNWVRTLLWSLRVCLLVVILSGLVEPGS